MITEQLFCLKLLDLKTLSLSTNHRQNFELLSEPQKLGRTVAAPSEEDHKHAAIQTYITCIKIKFYKKTLWPFSLGKIRKNELIPLIPKSNRALAKKAWNQDSPQNVSHLPQEGSRSVKLSRQVDLETATETVALFTVIMLAGAGGRNARAKRKTNKKEYNHILYGAGGTVLYNFD